MASMTGIEVGSDSCILVDVRNGAAGTGEVRAIHTMDPAEWRAHEVSRGDLLCSVRKSHRLPRRAVVVAWTLPGDGLDRESARATLQFVEDAGFRIHSILTPPQALARLARMRRRPGSPEARVWTALSMHGAAIAIVGRRELLFSRTWSWHYQPGLTGTRAQLLQRYSLIAHLASEVRHGIEVVRGSHGLSVDSVVTCGDLPELRSLTMPLIEELDVEVETLDSTDGLRAAGKVTAERLRESASAVRLACAAVLTSGDDQASRNLPAAIVVSEEPSRARRSAAALALIGALGWGAFLLRSIVLPVPVKPMPVPQRSAEARPVPPVTSIGSTPAPPQQAMRGRPAGLQADETSSEATDIGRDSTPVSTVLSVRAEPKLSAPAAGAPRPRLKVPLPAVELILMDQKRPRAVVGGAVVGVGDPVGPRTIVRIERDGVLLREPSGLVVRASIRRKQ
jgi:hypothetical protein